MTPKDINLVQSSFAKVAPVDNETGVRFYQRLFEIAPELKPLFRGDVEEQGRMFMSMLTVAVNGLADFDSIERRCASSRSATPATASAPRITRRSARR